MSPARTFRGGTPHPSQIACSCGVLVKEMPIKQGREILRQMESHCYQCTLGTSRSQSVSKTDVLLDPEDGQNIHIHRLPVVTYIAKALGRAALQCPVTIAGMFPHPPLASRYASVMSSIPAVRSIQL